MSWTLFVLQTVAVYSNSTANNWQMLGDYRSETACIQASRKLVEAQKQSTSWYQPNKFVCINRESGK